MLSKTIYALFLVKVLIWPAHSSTKELLVCEKSEGTIQCEEKNTVIFVEDAFYGRKNVTICADLSIELEKVYCMAPKSLPLVWKKCHGKTSCVLTATNSEFQTNPCPQFSKYLSVQYRCDNKESDIIGECPFEFWYPWMNADTPKGSGDYETFYRHQASLPEWCGRPQAVHIQLVDGSALRKRNDVIKTGIEYGVSCSNHHQNQTKCGDYKARFCCPSGCKELITNKTEGVITSPNYPSKYEPNTDCSWIITTDFDKYLTFTIMSLELEHRRNCIFDHVKIIDLLSGEEVFRDCALTDNSTSLKVSGNKAQIRFMSDEDNEGRGFSIEFKALKSISTY